MPTNITLEVPTRGSTVGTVGWLANQEIRISIGRVTEISIGRGTETKALGCWLHIGDQSEFVSVRGWDYRERQFPQRCEGIKDVPVNRFTPCENREMPLEGAAAFDTTWSDAAWSQVRQLIELARAQFLAHCTSEDAAEVEEARALSFKVIPKVTPKSMTPTPAA